MYAENCIYMELEQSLKEIIRIEARGNTSWAFMTDGRKKQLTNSINELEMELEKWNFVRIHPLHLINPLHFKHLSKIVLPHITMSDGALLPTDSNLVDFKSFNRPQKKHWWQIFPLINKPKKRFNIRFI